MAHEFFLPDIGEGLTEAVVVGWYVAVGDAVSLDEPLVEIETDKAVTDIPSPVGGVLLHRGAAPGDTLAVGGLLAVVGAAGEAWQPSPEGSAVEPAAPIVGSLETVPASPAAAAPAQALPLVRKLAGELGVDLATVSGSGPGGRITDDDVRAAAAAHGPEERVRMSSLRRTIADNLARSWQQIPHVTTFDEADAAPLLAQRERRGRPPLEALLIEMVLPLLVRFPAFNAAVAGDEIVYRKHYDVGFAVDTPEGLMVAVVHDAPAYEGEALADEVRRLADAARARTAAPQELRGQTFTISNIGAVGGRYGTPIVPLGTSAILSVGRADERPVVREGRVVVGREFPLSLSYDHRVIDGAAGRAFMGALVDAVETA